MSRYTLSRRLDGSLKREPLLVVGSRCAGIVALLRRAVEEQADGFEPVKLSLDSIVMSHRYRPGIWLEITEG